MSPITAPKSVMENFRKVYALATGGATITGTAIIIDDDRRAGVNWCGVVSFGSERL